MAIKEAKSLELLPRLTVNEKKVYTALVNYGANDVLGIAARGGLSKGRVPSAIERLIERGLVIPLEGDNADRRYIAIFPIERFTSIVDTLIKSLEARKSELEATTEIVNNFTENAIKNVREASLEEREKRTERSEEDIKDLEMAMDASFSGILASIEMDLQDLSRITKTSNEFLSESSLRTDETCANIHRQLKPLAKNFSDILNATQINARDLLEGTVDARVASVIDFETKANNAFQQVLEAFKDSQDAFEDIIFSVLDSGIADLEKVTRPINEQLEEAINSLKVAIQEAANNFQAEMVRVLTEQKRPMLVTIESFSPKAAKIAGETFTLQKETLETQHQSLAGLMENHASVYSEAIEQFARDFDNKLDDVVERSIASISSASEEMNLIEDKFKASNDDFTEAKDNLIHNVSNKVRDALNEMMEQFIVLLNREVAVYQMDLSDHVARMETDFLNAVEYNGTSIQNLVNFIKMAFTEPINTLLQNLDALNQKIDKDESSFLSKFDKTLNEDLMEISKEFNDETTKKESNFDKEIERILDRIARDTQNSYQQLRNQVSAKDKQIQNQFREFSAKHQKELRETTKELNNITRKLERWRLDVVKPVQKTIDDNLNVQLEQFSEKVNKKLASGKSKEFISYDEMSHFFKRMLNESLTELKQLGENINASSSKSLDEIVSTFKKDSLSINNRMVEFKEEQDKLIEATKYPSTKILQDIDIEYKQFYQKFNNTVKRFFETELDTFKRNRREVGRAIENTLNRKSSRTSKDILKLKDVFERSRTNYVNKTKESFERIDESIIKDTASLLDQEESTRSTITNLTEKIVSDMSNGVNTTAENLRTNLWEGAENIFGLASGEISKQEIELNEINDKQKDDAIKMYTEINQLHKAQLKTLDDKIDALRDRQIGNVTDFRKQYTQTLDDDLEKQLGILQTLKSDLLSQNDGIAEKIKVGINELTRKTVQEFEIQTSGIEGALISTVGLITSEASRRTEGVAVIGEQAVLGIEERYTENLEQIRQNLTDEVISRIEEEAKKIEQQKVDVKKIGREHLNEYGNAIIAVNNTLTADLERAEKAAQKTIIACQNISCRFLVDLNEEISAMSSRVGLSTDHLVRELLDGFERVLQKVKREAALFARKQFELSNKSNYEIAEAFLKSVDDLEEVMLKQIDSFAMRTNRSIDKTNEISVVVKDHIQDMRTSFKESTEG
ncbi:MAG: helix-turn-helix domain-containing protein [Candidatus Heimdallarchaeota archaeon]